MKDVHLVGVVSRGKRSYDAAIVHIPVVVARRPECRIRVVQLVTPGQVPISPQQIQYNTVHADSGIVGMKAQIDEYLTTRGGS